MIIFFRTLSHPFLRLFCSNILLNVISDFAFDDDIDKISFGTVTANGVPKRHMYIHYKNGDIASLAFTRESIFYDWYAGATSTWSNILTK